MLVYTPERSVTTEFNEKVWKPLTQRARLEKVEEARANGTHVTERFRESNSPRPLPVVPGTKQKRMGCSCKQQIRDKIPSDLGLHP